MRDVIDKNTIVFCHDLTKVGKGFRNLPAILANFAGWSVIRITLKGFLNDLITIAMANDAEGSARTCEWVTALTNGWTADFC